LRHLGHLDIDDRRTEKEPGKVDAVVESWPFCRRSCAAEVPVPGRLDAISRPTSREATATAITVLAPNFLAVMCRCNL
jgi:hypothetical protein